MLYNKNLQIKTKTDMNIFKYIKSDKKIKIKTYGLSPIFCERVILFFIELLNHADLNLFVTMSTYRSLNLNIKFKF